MKLISIIALLLTVICCSKGNKKQKNIPQNSVALTTISEPNSANIINEKEETLQDTFFLPEPNVDKIKEQELASSDCSLYIYLMNNYDSIGPRKPTSDLIINNPSCQFSQTFENGIVYEQNECGIGISRYKLITPSVSPSKIKRLFALLFDHEDYYYWSADSLRHRTSKDGLEGAGGDYTYEQLGDKLIVTLEYTD